MTTDEKAALEPSAELKALYLELTAALVRVQGILKPTVEMARRAHNLLEEEGAATCPDSRMITGEEWNEWWEDWMLRCGESEMSAMVDRVCELLHEYEPDCELP